MTSLFGHPILLPVGLALLVGFLLMPALNIFRVNKRGLGLEYAQLWRAKFNGLARGINRLFALFSRLHRHPLMRPLAIAAALLLALMGAPVAFGATLSESSHAGEFLLEERMAEGRPSRDNITVLSGQNLVAGAVVGRVTLGIGRCSVPAVVGTGNGTMSKVFPGPEVLVGNYVVKCTALAANGGTFSVTNPAGKALPPFVMAAGSGGQAVAYTGREINFTVTDGGTDFAVNDSFTIAVDTTAPAVVGTGNGTISALSLGPDGEPGLYQFVCTTAATNGGTFTLTNPRGAVLGLFAMTAGAGTATAFVNRQINFTLTDGATDFVAGDTFNVAVFNQLSGGKVVAWDPTTFDGRHKVAGILYDAIDASSTGTNADTAGVIVARDAAVRQADLTFAAAITAAQQDSAVSDLLKFCRIVCR